MYHFYFVFCILFVLFVCFILQVYMYFRALIRKELQDWEVSKLWPLSCFAAQKDQQCLPGVYCFFISVFLDLLGLWMF